MRPLELYIHIPFCVKKCRYCDFLSAPATPEARQEYVMGLCQKIRSYYDLAGMYHVSSIFIGGGTPSILETQQMRSIFDAIRATFPIDSDAEITVEVNPGTVDKLKLMAYRNVGINRLSIGLQSTDDQELKMLGRIHTYKDFLDTYTLAREVGFQNINVDLMSGIPFQTLGGWEDTLKKVAELGPEHISAYSLIIEEGTPFYEKYGEGERAEARRRRELPDEDTENRIYHLTRDFLGEMGYQRYEISNYAKPGKECCHNIGYWTEVSYLGLGLGASSYMDGCRFSNEKDLRRYLALDLEHDCGEGLRELAGPVEQLSREARMEEFMFLGLRMTRGVSEMDFVRLFGVKMETVYGAVIERLMANGLLKKEGVWLSLTEWGMDVSNFVLSEFLLS